MRFSECLLSKSLSIKSFYTAFEESFSPDYSFSGEIHDFWELVIVTDGEVGVCAGNSILMLQSGNAILHKPMEFHRIWSEGHTSPKVLIISFGADLMPELSTRLFSLNADEIKSAENLLSELSDAFEIENCSVKQIRTGKSLESELTVKKFEVMLLTIIYRCGIDFVIDTENKSKRAKKFADVISFLEDNLCRRINTDEIAEECKMSTSNLKKVFLKYSGIGIMAYFNMMKMQKAELLLKSGMSVGETASHLGFTDQYYFSTVFKKIIGKTPSSYISYKN